MTIEAGASGVLAGKHLRDLTLSTELPPTETLRGSGAEVRDMES